MNVIKCLKTSFVFIGTIIGAGFATGREIMLFFGKSSPVIPILSAITCGIFAYLFLYAGHKKLNIIPHKGGRILLLSFFVAAFIVYSAMISASEQIIFETLSISGGGVATALIICIICLTSDNGMKTLNFIVVPLIIILIIFIGIRMQPIHLPKKIFIHNAIAYAALNMFLGGFLIVPDGRGMNRKEMVLTSLLTIVLLTGTITVLYYVVLHSSDADMPVMEAARSINATYIAAAIIFLAIITTMAGCFTAITAIASSITHNKWLSGIAILIKGVITAIIGFRLIVDLGYPIVSIIGVIYTVRVIIAVIKGNNSNRLLLLSP